MYSFYEWIEEYARTKNIDPSKPFLFILKGKVTELNKINIFLIFYNISISKNSKKNINPSTGAEF
jgi:hypothetical protein